MASDGGGPPRPAAAPAGAALEALYQERILDHYRRPRHREPLPGASVQLAWRNPLCGDELELWLAMDGERVGDLRVSARGCSLSVASASMLTELAPGRTAAELRELRTRFHAMLEGGAGPDERLGDLRAFAALRRVPARWRCAELPWEALERALADARASR